MRRVAVIALLLFCGVLPATAFAAGPKERIVIVQNAAWPVAENDALFASLSRMQGAVHDAAAPEFPPTMKR